MYVHQFTPFPRRRLGNGDAEGVKMRSESRCQTSRQASLFAEREIPIGLYVLFAHDHILRVLGLLCTKSALDSPFPGSGARPGVVPSASREADMMPRGCIA
eukprot:1177042-Prorocentrum_minimum.AAC.1